MRQQEKASLEIDGLELFAPEFVAQGHHREAEILLAQALLLQQSFRQALQALAGQRLRSVEVSAELMSGGPKAIAELARLRNHFQVRGAWAFAGRAARCSPI